MRESLFEMVIWRGRGFFFFVVLKVYRVGVYFSWLLESMVDMRFGDLLLNIFVTDYSFVLKGIVL